MQATITRQEQNANEFEFNIKLLKQDIDRLQNYLAEDISPSERSQVEDEIWQTKMALVSWMNQLDEALDELFS